MQSGYTIQKNWAVHCIVETAMTRTAQIKKVFSFRNYSLKPFQITTAEIQAEYRFSAYRL